MEPPKRVVCCKQGSNAYITAGNEYEVKAANSVSYQIVNDKGKLFWYSTDHFFVPLNQPAKEPEAPSTITSDGGSTSYYTLPKWATELRHLIAFKRMNYNVGNIFKAAYRLGEKTGTDTRYDLNKIIFMAQAELEELDRMEGKV